MRHPLQRRRTRKRLKDTVASLERMIATAPIGLSEAEVGPDGAPRLRFLSPRALSLVGLPAEMEDATVEDFMRHMHDDDRQRFLEANRQAIINQAAMDVDVRFVVDGQLRWLKVMSTPCESSQGTKIWSGFIADVTESRLNSERLAESEARFRTLLDDVDGVAVQGYRLDGSVTYWNRAAEALYGFSRAEALESNLLDLIIPEQMRAEVRQNLSRVADGGQIESGELELQARDGRRIPVYSSHTVLRPPGQPPELFCIDIDLRERKRYEQQAVWASQYDGLTGLPNRMLLNVLAERACARARSRGEYLVCCYLDLDQFKAVNDQYGSAIGNRLLRTVALRLKRRLSSADVISRVGGDEFVLLLGDITRIAELQQMLQDILDHISRPLRLRGHVVRTSASIGVTIYPQDHDEPEALLRHANQAMLAAKQEGRNRFIVFDPSIGADMRRRRSMLLEIEKGLQEEQFVLYFQPKVDMQSMQPLGLEALVRWQHPARGLLGPHAFLDFLDDSDLEYPFGEYVLTAALRHLEQWRQEGLRLAVSVNISGPHLRRADFSERLRALLQQFPLIEPSQVELEILESATAMDLDQVSRTLSDCRSLGVRVALDDFGTGYSSLSRLGSLPMDVLKIDQSFVRSMLEDVKSLSIVKSVIGLARAFNMEVIAEGVETPAHALSLIALECDHGQGYAFAKPLPAAAVSDWIRQWQECELARRLTSERPITTTSLALIVAANSHKSWHARMRQAIQEGTAAPEEPGDHEHCSLGLWLKDEGQRLFGDNAEFRELLALHEAFHDRAQQAVQACQKDFCQKSDDAKDEWLQELDRTSERLEHLIVHLGSTS